MADVKEIVFKCHNKIMKEKGINKESSEELTLTRDNGIDSMGIVSFVIDLEDELDTELERHLSKVRKCRTIGDLITLLNIVVK